METKTNRIDPEFNRELEEIQKELMKNLIPKKDCSIRALTSALVKYKGWLQIKNDIYTHILLKKNGK